MYIADIATHTVHKVTPAGVVSTVAGTPGVPGHADGVGTLATFDTPANVAVDSAGNPYVSDFGNGTIRKNTQAGVVSTIAVTARVHGSADRTGPEARFSNLDGVAVDASRNVYVSDQSSHKIRKTTSAGVVTTLAGTAGLRDCGTAGLTGYADGAGAAAHFNLPSGLAIDKAGYVYVAD